MTVQIISEAIHTWAAYYDDHRTISVLIRFVHLAAIVFGAGSALVLDQRVLRAAWKFPSGRDEVVASLRSEHPKIITCVAILGFTGILMTAADSATFVSSKLFWFKMALIAALIANGGLMMKAERGMGRLGGTVGWTRIAVASAISGLLWLAILYVGTLLSATA
jgi:hypothetical protein